MRKKTRKRQSMFNVIVHGCFKPPSSPSSCFSVEWVWAECDNDWDKHSSFWNVLFDIPTTFHFKMFALVVIRQQGIVQYIIFQNLLSDWSSSVSLFFLFFVFLFWLLSTSIRIFSFLLESYFNSSLT